MQPGLVHRHIGLRLHQGRGKAADGFGGQAGLCALHEAGTGTGLRQLRLGLVELGLHYGGMGFQPVLRIGESREGLVALMVEVELHGEVGGGGGELRIAAGEGNGEDA